MNHSVVNYNAIFFSNHCEKSKFLISLLQKENFLRWFHVICVDNNRSLPFSITNTPVLVVKGVPTPYIGADTFTWVARMKRWQTNVMLQKMNGAQQQYIHKINSNLIPVDNSILGFSETEMNSMSDAFAFFSTNVNQECQDAFPQQYVQFDNIGKDYIETPPLENGSYRVSKPGAKINAAEQKKMLDSLSRQREAQDLTFRETLDGFCNQRS